MVDDAIAAIMANARIVDTMAILVRVEVGEDASGERVYTIYGIAH